MRERESIDWKKLELKERGSNLNWTWYLVNVGFERIDPCMSVSLSLLLTRALEGRGWGKRGGKRARGCWWKERDGWWTFSLRRLIRKLNLNSICFSSLLLFSNELPWSKIPVLQIFKVQKVGNPAVDSDRVVIRWSWLAEGKSETSWRDKEVDSDFDSCFFSTFLTINGDGLSIEIDDGA